MKWDWTRSFPDIFYCIIKYVIALRLVTDELSSLQPVFYINTKTSKPLQEAAFCYPWLRTEVNQNLKYNKKTNVSRYVALLDFVASAFYKREAVW